VFENTNTLIDFCCYSISLYEELATKTENEFDLFFLKGIKKMKKVKRLTMSIVTVSEASTGVTMVVTASRTKVQWIFWSAMSRLAADKPPAAS
jgi:hypothetical protein